MYWFKLTEVVNKGKIWPVVVDEKSEDQQSHLESTSGVDECP